MTAPPCLPLAVVDLVTADYRAALARSGLPPQLTAAAERMLVRCMPPNWALEWSLPWWLGEAWGINPQAARAMVLANVLGLTFVRLQDDLVDGAAEAAGQLRTLLLSPVLLRAWTDVYARSGLTSPAFWQSFDAYLQQWVGATWHSQQPSVSFDLHDREALFALAHRGAPLKSCIAAACILAERCHLRAALVTAVDELLTGAVLLDHAQDWAEDVAASRWNAFVCYATGSAQPAPRPADARRAVVQEMAVGSGGRPYFAVIQSYLCAAAERAEAAGLQPLAAYTRWLKDAASTFCTRWRRQTRHDLRQATSALLPYQALSDVQLGDIQGKGDHHDGFTGTDGSIDRPRVIRCGLPQAAAGRS